MYFEIKDTLKEVTLDELIESKNKYVAILTSEEWRENRDVFDMGIELEIEPDTVEIFTTKAEVNYDSLTGSFSIPCRDDFSREDAKFSFALDEKGIVFIDDSDNAKSIIDNIIRTKKWRVPSLERFIYDFLDMIVKDDLRIMEKYERELDVIEDAIDHDKDEVRESDRVNDIRSDIRDLSIHYNQLIDLGEELEENENNFFSQKNLRYFRLFISRVERFNDRAASLRDYTVQIRDLYKAHLDIKQNRIMTVLTVVTSIFMPLTLIVGWYGMNFKYMPELDYRWSYPIVAGICVLIVTVGLILFKKKKWL
ncbi:MAG: magnesium transporter CorA [Lachnospiraceae bacterium]|nr:magnesium transporter CorA [Lachnospiraceae bacterium]